MSILWSYVVFSLYSNALSLETWMKIFKLCFFIKKNYLIYLLQRLSHLSQLGQVDTESELTLDCFEVEVRVLKLWSLPLCKCTRHIRKASFGLTVFAPLCLYFPSLARTLPANNFCSLESQTAQGNRSLVYSSIYPLTSYNLQLRLQRPGLKLNQWLRSFPSRSVWVFREFSHFSINYY